MIKIDLITGFLGSGKTTFIKNYASFLINQGIKVGIIENDFGAINVDALLLQELEGPYCSVEQIVGGNLVEDWKRRFRAKLIAMAMQGFERILVEPSGVYEADAFFDVLYEEPLDRWYEAGSVISIVEAFPEKEMSKEERYFLAAQMSHASKIVLSKGSTISNSDLEHRKNELNEILQEFKSARVLSTDQDLMAKPWEEWQEKDYIGIMESGWKRCSYEKTWINKTDSFQSEFFMHYQMDRKSLQSKINTVLQDRKCGNIARVKGFIKSENNMWIQFNASKECYTEEESTFGQEVFIVIGQDLHRENIDSILCDRSKIEDE